jgi:UPF0755 protein
MSIKQLLFQLFLGLIVFALVYQIRSGKLNNPEAISAEETEILIYDSVNLEDLIEILYQYNVQFDSDELIWAAGIYNRSQFLQGRYYLDGSMRYETFLGKLARGEQDPKRIIVRAGQTYQRFFDRVPTQFRFTTEDLRSVMRDTVYIREELGLEPHLLFGRMIPNTYEMFWTITPKQFVERMLTEFDRATAGLEEKAAEFGLTMDEVVTFASIIELEALYDVEKPKIAGLYWNRINQRWRLQADPTVSYAIGERRRLRFSDYRFRHPYNTYTIYGLPPGPITNPAIASIRAVLEPETHPYMFMVATPEGLHTFTRTYDEHRRESAKWTQWLREQQRIREARQREELQLKQLMQATI